MSVSGTVWFRTTDNRAPAIWQSSDQPPARWHAAGEGPVAYLADTPDGAWAEFLRHEGITDVDDLAGVTRDVWAIEVPAEVIGSARAVPLSVPIMTGGVATYGTCQHAVRQLREGGVPAVLAPSAALIPDGASPRPLSRSANSIPARDGRVLALFDPSGLVGWVAARFGQPDADLVGRVRPLRN